MSRHPTVADRLAAKTRKSHRRHIGRGEAGLIVGIGALALFGLAWLAAMAWWLVWSILDLTNGNPATWWNVTGLVIPSISLLGWAFRKESR